MAGKEILCIQIEGNKSATEKQLIMHQLHVRIQNTYGLSVGVHMYDNRYSVFYTEDIPRCIVCVGQYSREIRLIIETEFPSLTVLGHHLS